MTPPQLFTFPKQLGVWWALQQSQATVDKQPLVKDQTLPFWRVEAGDEASPRREKGTVVRPTEGVTLDAILAPTQAVTMVWTVPRPLGSLELHGSKVAVMAFLTAPRLSCRT